MRKIVFLLAVLILSPLMLQAQLAATPPMGWNSWDSYGLTINEAEFKQNVDWFHAHLKPYGWQYVVIDEGWYLSHPDEAGQSFTMDANGRYVPAVDRFPSATANRGFKPLAAYVHSLGLKFGIHIIQGIPRQAVERNLPIAGSSYHAADAANTSDTCQWNHDNYGVRDNAAGQAYYDSIAKLYAEWGVDFVKVDCISSRPYRKTAIHMVSAALRKTGRPIVLSLSPGATPLADAADVVKQAQMWRIADDFWDHWDQNPKKTFTQGVLGQFPLLAEWAPHAGPGHWPDADMLPIGWLGPHPGWHQARMSNLTPDEVRTVLTLWSIARSPLMLGTNLTRMDPATEAMITNREVLVVDQDSTGNKATIHTPQSWVWTARAAQGRGNYVALFNVSDAPLNLKYSWQALGLVAGKHTARDLWLHKNLGKTSGINITLPPHASALYRVE